MPNNLLCTPRNLHSRKRLHSLHSAKDQPQRLQATIQQPHNPVAYKQPHSPPPCKRLQSHYLCKCLTTGNPLVSLISVLAHDPINSHCFEFMNCVSLRHVKIWHLADETVLKDYKFVNQPAAQIALFVMTLQRIRSKATANTKSFPLIYPLPHQAVWFDLFKVCYLLICLIG